MKIYSVGLNNPDGLYVIYGMFTQEKAFDFARQKMAEIEDTYEEYKEVINFNNLNITITGYTLNAEDEFSVASWILREDGKFTSETDDDRIEFLEKEADKLGFTLV